jgi:hypothetical protein
MQADTSNREHLKTHLAAIGVELDDARLDQLLPVYGGILSAARRLASLDLGEAEPAMTFRHTLRPEAGR